MVLCARVSATAIALAGVSVQSSSRRAIFVVGARTLAILIVEYESSVAQLFVDTLALTCFLVVVLVAWTLVALGALAFARFVVEDFPGRAFNVPRAHAVTGLSV